MDSVSSDKAIKNVENSANLVFLYYQFVDLVFYRLGRFFFGLRFFTLSIINLNILISDLKLILDGFKILLTELILKKL